MAEFEKGLAEVLRPIVGEVHLPAASAAAAYVRTYLASDAVVERAASELTPWLKNDGNEWKSARQDARVLARAALAAVME